MFHDLQDSDESLMKYLNYGGLSGLRQIGLDSDEHVWAYLSSVFNTIMLKDIIERHDILMGEQVTRDREFGPLEKIRDNHPKYVISATPFHMIVVLVTCFIVSLAFCRSFLQSWTWA